MKKWGICKATAILIVLIVSQKAEAQELRVLRTTQLPDYPSASTLEFHKNRLYVIGDDAPHMMVLDSNHKVLDKVRLFPGKERRIAKSTKPDLETSILLRQGAVDYLVGIPSFSAKDRNKVVVINLSDNRIVSSDLTFFNTRMKELQLQDQNIEGSAWVNNKLLLGSRANGKHKHNHLILSDFSIGEGIRFENARLIRLQLPRTEELVGISGFVYVPEKDLLLFTASTEAAPDAYADGRIGDSYLGYIENISRKLGRRRIKADYMMNLTEALQVKEPVKMEAVAVQTINKDGLTVHLAADNDNGKSTLYKVEWQPRSNLRAATP
ncbi:MAG TPA: hypothetical protein VHK69_17300 [Chitinophagaceae bacterium]|nr:hypothetical protein [Chitinophagaceae bacterium]